MQPPVGLLNATDLDVIERLGIPSPPRPDLVVFGEGEAPVFTLKGRQFYARACALNGVPFRPQELSCRQDVEDLGYAVDLAGLRRACRELEWELQANLVPSQEVDFARALARGSVQQVVNAGQRLRHAQAAGPNVMPVSFFRRP